MAEFESAIKNINWKDLVFGNNVDTDTRVPKYNPLD